MTVKRCILGTLAGVFFALGVYFVAEAAVAYMRADVGGGGGTLSDWLFELIMLQRRNALLFDLCDALWFLRLIPALAVFDLLFCVAGKKFSAGMLGVALACFAVLILSLAAEPLDVYARKYLLEGSLSAGETQTLAAAVGACELLVLCCMAGLSAAYIALKRKHYRR